MSEQSMLSGPIGTGKARRMRISMGRATIREATRLLVGEQLIQAERGRDAGENDRPRW
jgi:hypothetical protein